MVEKLLTPRHAHEKTQNQPGYETTILDWRTPPNRVQEILQNRKVTIYPFARDTVSDQADGSTTQFTASHDLVDSPNIDDEDNVVALVDGSQVTVTSYDASANTVTLDSAPGSSATVTLLYPPSSGNIRLLATTPDEESGVEELLNEHVATFTRNNQVVPTTARQIDNSFILDEKWHLLLKLKADWTLAQWSDPVVQRARVVVERLRKSGLSGKQKQELKRDKQQMLNNTL